MNDRLLDKIKEVLKRYEQTGKKVREIVREMEDEKKKPKRKA